MLSFSKHIKERKEMKNGVRGQGPGSRAYAF